MSFNISKKVLDVAEVTTKVELWRLGERQQASFKRFIESGVVVGSGVPAVLASRWMRTNNLPHIHMSTYWTGFEHTPVWHPLREMLRQAVAMTVIEMGEELHDDYAEDALRALSNAPSPLARWDERYVRISRTTRKFLSTHRSGYVVPEGEVVFRVGLDESDNYGSI